jgi:A/G-specific adenine glycosylase
VGALLALPGIGSYTAAAVASFAYGQRHAVLDTNVRRVLARLVTGQPGPAPALSVAETRLAQSLLPVEPAVAARWSVAVMELGALVCTAASPRLRLAGRWPAAGRGQATIPALRRDGPAVPRPPARGAARLRYAGAPRGFRRGLGRGRAAGPRA